MGGSKFGIRLIGSKEHPSPDYDEWSCIDDMDAEHRFAGLAREQKRKPQKAWRKEPGCNEW